MTANLHPGLFVTGTDTNVGKTAVSCALLRLARRAGHRLIPFKPVETGASSPETAADTLALCRAAGQPLPLADLVGATFPLPAAPSVAAAAAGASLELRPLAERAQRLRAGGDGLLVEGAGGLLVPYRGSFTAADLAARLALPVLVVARAALGTINHTALTVAELRRRALPLAGIILSESLPATHDPALDASNQIAILTGVRPLGLLPYVPDADDDQLAAALLTALGPPAVAGLLGISTARLAV